MMRCLLVLLAVATMVLAKPPKGGPFKDMPKRMACMKVLMPKEERELMEVIANTCISQQDGLSDIIEQLEAAEESKSGENSSEEKGDKKRPGPPEMPDNACYLLEEANYGDEADILKRCIVKEKGHMAEDGSFMVYVFKQSIKDKVADTDFEENVAMGLDECPEEDLVSFKPPKFMHCVMAYCASGAAPLPDRE